MKTRDKVATVIFWTVAGGVGLFIGFALAYTAIARMLVGDTEAWWLGLGIGVLFIGLSSAGIWQCIRSFRQAHSKEDAA